MELKEVFREGSWAPGYRRSTDSFDWALEIAGGLKLQLISHRMDLESIKSERKKGVKIKWGGKEGRKM